MDNKRTALQGASPLILVLITLILLNGCAVNPATGGNDFVLMSEQQELSLGRNYSQQVMKDYRAYDNPSLQQYIQSVGNKVANNSHRKNIFFRFTLLDSTQVNAFALPGGYIYITRGLLAYLNSEAELAAVLGHEVAHVTARHSVRQHAMSTATSLLGALAGAATGVQGVGQLTNLVGTGIVRGYGREHELEADKLGAGYLARSGYSAWAMHDVITTLKNQELFDKKLASEQGRPPRAYHGVFSTHPKNDTRLQQVIRLAAGGGAKSAQRQDAKFLKRLAGLTFGNSEKDGLIRDRVFYHKDLNFKLSFPKGWLVSNSANQITAAAPKGSAGLQLVLQDINKKTTPRKFMRTVLNIDQTVSEQALNINGFRGHTAVVLGKVYGKQQKIRASVLFVGSRAFIFLASAKQNNLFSQYDKQFMSSIKSFSRLSKADYKIVKELKISLVRSSNKTRLAALAGTSPIALHAEDQLRLLNGIFPSGEVKQGDLMKKIR
ncbi:MAG: peptidase M48 [Cycloclasticus sp. symbiont of Poecilosclerida sp. M]|nr:MAG: peptidase M48 [Cycloclasticus sp. symbiont of Poecilosclerida sp. M]